MFASIKSATVVGVLGTVIRVEVHTSSGFPGYTVVGMPDTAMRESKERIRAALLSSSVNWPKSRITINLAPANLRKSGTGSELAILIGLLCASGELDRKRFLNTGVIGEVGLDGTVRPVPGTIARVMALAQSGVEQIFVPQENAYEASLVKGVEVFPIATLSGLLGCLRRGEPWPVPATPSLVTTDTKQYGDYSEINGQASGCEAMMLLAAGGHNTLMMGSPGIGKTMLAERLPSILPELSETESQEITAIKSVLDGNVADLASTRPFRTPHHSASAPALIGSGTSHVVAGEVTRAHRGVLFLDELSEFPSRTLDALRQPLESGYVSIARASFSAKLPSQFSLLACSNPCPCAKPREKCICTDAIRQRYMRRLSGPLLDRFDIRLELFRSPYVQGATHTSSNMKEKIDRAYAIQKERFKECNFQQNAQLKNSMLNQFAPLTKTAYKFFHERIEKREISGRGAVAIWRLARTLADMEATKDISDIHLSRAFDFREEIQ